MVKAATSGRGTTINAEHAETAEKTLKQSFNSKGRKDTTYCCVSGPVLLASAATRRGRELSMGVGSAKSAGSAFNVVITIAA